MIAFPRVRAPRSRVRSSFFGPAKRSERAHDTAEASRSRPSLASIDQWSFGLSQLLPLPSPLPLSLSTLLFSVSALFSLSLSLCYPPHQARLSKPITSTRGKAMTLVYAQARNRKLLALPINFTVACSPALTARNEFSRSPVK